MAAAVQQASFTAGEFSPALWSRTDIDKYHSGAAILRNFFVDYRGGASTRPGTQFIGACKAILGQPRLIPFIVSTIATYVLEFGDQYIRFISNGAYVEDPPGTPVEVVSPYLSADLPLLKYTQSANVLTITHPSYPVYNLTRTSATAFALDLDLIGPSINPPFPVTTAQVNSGGGNGFLYGYVVTCVSATGEESLASIPTFVAGALLNQLTGINNTLSWAAVDGANFYKIYKVGPTPSGNGNTSTPISTVYGYCGNSATTSFVDNNIGPDYSQTPPQFSDPFSPGQLSGIRVSTPGAGYADPVYTLIFAGDGTGATGYAIADKTTGLVVGAVLTNPGRGYTSCTVSDVGPNTASYQIDLGQEDGTYPFVPGYFQQRRVFGGTMNFPEAIVMSQPGNYDNFDTSPIQLPTDGITASLAGRQVNAIKSLVAMNTGLVVFTSGGGFLVSGGGPESAISPDNVVALPQASNGANDMPPLVINYDVLYFQNRGNVVRDLAFNFYVQSYTGTDRSVLASHLFTNYTSIEWAYSEEPFRLVQVVRSDGILLNFTYVPEQEIFAWSHSDTNGFFRSIASIPEGNENAAYVVVQRYVGGTWRYYTERFVNRSFPSLSEAWCMDSALSTDRVRPAAGIVLSAITGTITVTASSAVFAPGDVGKTLWAGSGRGLVTGYTNSTHITIESVADFDAVTDNPDDLPVPYAVNEWQLNPNVTTVSGLDHLEGLAVNALVDGVAIISGLTVTGGSITLANAGSIIIVGLPFTCQLQTLPLDVGEPTIQGKRKLLAAATIRVTDTLGLSIGRDFASVFPMEEVTGGSTFPPVWIDGLIREPLNGEWAKEGQMCFETSLPLPATILGVIPEVVVGDTAR